MADAKKFTIELTHNLSELEPLLEKAKQQCAALKETTEQIEQFKLVVGTKRTT